MMALRMYVPNTQVVSGYVTHAKLWIQEVSYIMG